MRQWAAALLAAAVVAAAVPAGARAESCPAGDKIPEVKVRTEMAETEYRHDRSRKQLTAISQQPGTSKHGTVTLGLTVPKVGTNWQIGWETRSDGRRHCAYVTKADVRFAIQSMKVYVAREYRQGSCEYSAVLVHENEHVRLYRTILQSNAPKLEEAIRKELARMGPTMLRDANSRPATTERLSGVVQKFVEQMYWEFEQANAAIDTPENYKRTHQRCENWFARR